MHATELATLDYFRDLADRLDTAGHGTKSTLINAAQNMLGISRQQIYRGLQAAGWESGRKVRADRGASAVTDDDLRTIGNIYLESIRNNGKRGLPWDDAVKIAKANRLLTSDCSAGNYLRIARERGLHPEQLNQAIPYQEMRSLHPNHVWQFDVSLCRLFYLDKHGVEPMDKKRFYKNKDSNFEKIGRFRVLRYLITDHTTGAFFVKYYLGSGEDQETLFEFLMDAFGKREHSQDPLHGVPWVMIWDAGSANQSHLIKQLLKNLGVDHWHHMPGNPRAKGQVEGTHNIVERSFEGRLSLMDIRNIDQLNAAAHAWMRHYCGMETHRRHGHSRYGLWQTINQAQLRICPPRAVCEQLLQTKPEERTVKGNLTITYKVKGFDTLAYSVADVPNVRVGDSVIVTVNPYHAPNIYILHEREQGTDYITCEPIVTDAYGFTADAPVWGQNYASKGDTDSSRTRKQMLKDAYGADTNLAVDKARASHAPTFGGAVDPIGYLEAEHQTAYMQRRGSELNVPERARVEEKPLTHVQAAKLLRNNHSVTMDTDRFSLIQKWYPDGVMEADIPNVAQRLSGWTEKNLGLRLVM